MYSPSIFCMEKATRNKQEGSGQNTSYVRSHKDGRILVTPICQLDDDTILDRVGESWESLFLDIDKGMKEGNTITSAKHVS